MNVFLFGLGYVTDVLQESIVYSEHAGKTELDLEDLRLGIKGYIRSKFSQPLSRDVCFSLARFHSAVSDGIFITTEQYSFTDMLRESWIIIPGR